MSSMRRQAVPGGDDDLDLGGRSVLFVGGLKQQVPHMRRYVAACHGSLEHHDGGMEDNMSRLGKLFGRADFVLFPVDCVSHAAQNEVKRLCRRWDKPYLVMPSASISVFKQGLRLLLQQCVVPPGTEPTMPAAWPPTGPSPGSLSRLAG